MATDEAPDIAVLEQEHRQAAAKWRRAQEAADELQREMHSAYLTLSQAQSAAERRAEGGVT